MVKREWECTICEMTYGNPNMHMPEDCLKEVYAQRNETRMRLKQANRRIGYQILCIPLVPLAFFLGTVAK